MKNQTILFFVACLLTVAANAGGFRSLNCQSDFGGRKLNVFVVGQNIVSATITDEGSEPMPLSRPELETLLIIGPNQVILNGYETFTCGRNQ